MSDGRPPFSVLLRQMRSAASLSQEELAERSGVSVRGISDLERGLRHAPRLETVRLLADGLALSDDARAALLAAARPALLQRSAESLSSSEQAPLPTPLTRLIGRESELAALLVLLDSDDRRLLTITGSGGTGKTRLALEIAALLRDRYKDGIAFVDLTPLIDAALVVPTIAATLGVRESAEQALLSTLSHALTHKHLLLVLDNCERVLAAAPEITTLLSACPGLTVLATSRQRLHVAGEREFQLLPLPLPAIDCLPALAELAQVPAVALFVDRATAVQPDFALTVDNAPAVAGICRRLDGLPLAIELAAARIKVLPLQTLLERLEPRLPLLTGGGRDLPARQRTMRDAISWSYDLLAVQEQSLFRRFAVFVGGFTLPAAEAVGASRAQVVVLDGVGALVEQSLVHQIPGAYGEPRFLMLETVREFGIEQLAAIGETDDARQRHAEYFLSLATSPRFAGPVLMNLDTLARLIADLDNVRLALAWYDDRGDIDALLWLSTLLYGMLYGQWLAQGPYREGLQWVERALERSSHMASAAQVRALDVAGTVAVMQGQYVRAEGFLAKAQALARELGDPLLVGETLTYAGWLSYRQRDYPRADRLLNEGFSLLRSVDESAHWAFPFQSLGDCALAQEHFDRAEAFFREAIDRFHDAGYDWGVNDARVGLAGVAYCMGDLALAAGRYRTSLEKTQPGEHGFPIYVASALIGLAAVAASRHPEPGAHLLGAAEGMIEALHAPMYPRDQPILDRGLSALLSALGAERLAAAQEVGRSMTVEQAIAAAMEVAEAVAPSLTVTLD